nr:zinc ribbon domain-containing protein [Roseiflexaceae bacterium]
MKCSTCGADNDAANKFCDQCGSRLQSAMPAAAPALEALPNCPNCGAAIVPGEAFCDECGTALTTPVPAAGGLPIVNNDAPTVFAPPAGLPLGGPTCTVCGRQNAPGDRFCDECGASLAEDPAAVVPPVPEPVVPPAEPLPDVVAQSPVDTP